MDIFAKLEKKYWYNAGAFMQENLTREQYDEISGIDYATAILALGKEGVRKYLFVLCMRFALQNIIEKRKNKIR